MSRRLFRLALYFLLGLSLARFGASVARAAVTPSHGFVGYYTAARLLHEGQPVVLFYDVRWYQSQMARIEPRANDVFAPNPPLMPFILLPLAGLSHDAARPIWTVVNLLVLLLAVTTLLHAAGLSMRWRLLAWIVVLNFQPVLVNFQFGQAYILVLALAVAVWLGWRRGRAWFAGLPLGVMLAFKSAGLIWWPLLALRRQWGTLAAGLLTTAGVALLSVPFTGLDSWREYFDLLMRFAARPELSVTAYQSVSSLFRHLFAYDAQWNSAPLFHAPALASGLTIVVVAIVLATSLYAAHRADDDLAFALFAVLAVAFSPVSLDYHYPLLLIPLAILAAWAGRRSASWPWLVLAAAVLAIGLDLPYRSLRLFEGAWALLAYPKLYGAGLLWALAAWACLRPRPLPAETHDAA
jgi:hypothetical protein